MPASALALLLFGALGLCACSTAHDGTILYPNPVNRLLGTEEPEGKQTTAVFPAAPPPPARVAKEPAPARPSKLRLWDVRPVRPPLVSASTAASLLSCHDETQAGGRVKVVCE